MFQRFIFYFAGFAVSLMLVSCATVEQQPVATEIATEKKKSVSEPAGWPEEQLARRQIRVWEIRGRLGVQTGTNGGSMDIIWKQSGDDFSIHLIAPLGAGNYMIQGNDQYAEILFPDGHREFIDNVDEVFASALEIDLPASAIKDWIRGLPASSFTVDTISWNKLDLIERIQQDGWNVELKKYTGNGVLLPHQLYLSHDGNEDLDVRLALRQWMLDN